MQRSSSLNVAPLTPTVKWLIIITVGVWFFCEILLDGFMGIPIQAYFSLIPSKFLFDFQIWQILTYMFLHSLHGVTHITFNMLMLWMFGGELEQLWGRRFFLLYYLLSGIGAGLLYVTVIFVYGQVTGSFLGMSIPVLGASGALFALMLAHGVLFGERVILFFMLFPMKSKYFVMILGFIQFVSLLTSNIAGGGVSYLAHLGGLISGFVILWISSIFKRFKADRKKRFKNRNLRLVVDNDSEKNSSKSKDPKYWN